MTGRYGTQDAALLAENEELKAKLARYESAVTWETSCLSCARVLDSCALETERREKAEAAVGRLLALFDKPDARGVRFAATTVGRLDRIVADMGPGSPEADVGGPEGSGTADGTPEAGASS